MKTAVNWYTRPARILASLALTALVTLGFSGNADTLGNEYTETAFERALITFASARAINGLISVAQGTELALQPGGIGAVLAPGEVLDPINDLVEQFSQVMLFSTVVLGMQKILIEISGWFWFSVIMACALLLWLATLWLPRYFSGGVQRLTLGFLGILLLIRFLVPVAAIANEAVFDLFLEPGYQVANRYLETAARELGSEAKHIDPAGEPADAEQSLLEALGEFYQAAKNRADVSAKIESLRNAANKTAEEMIYLIALFMVQTLLLPLLFAWLGFAAAKGLIHYVLQSSA